MAVWGTLALGFLEQEIRGSGSRRFLSHLYHDHHDHSLYAGRLECGRRRVSSHAGQCRLFDEGSGPLCGIILFAQTRCRADTRFCGIGEAIGKLDPLGLASSNNVKFT